MICALTKEQQLDFYGTIASFLFETANNDQPLNLKDFMKMLHEELGASPEEEELTMSYLQLVPGYIDEISAFQRDIKKALRSKGFDFSELTDLVLAFEDETSGLEAVKNYVSPVVTENELKDLEDAQKKKDSAISTKVKEPSDVNQTNVNQVIEDNETEVIKAKVNTSDDPFFNAAKPTALATVDNEAISSKREDPNFNVPKSELVPYFYTLRNIIRKIFGYPDASKTPVGPKEGIYLTAIKTTEIEKRYPGKGYLRPDIIVKDDDSGVMLMLTDKTGEPLTFNLDPQNPSYGEYDANGKPLMFFMKAIYPSMKKDGKVVSIFKSKNPDVVDDQAIIESMIRAGAYSGSRKEIEERAEKELLSQLQIIDEIRTFLNNNPSERILLNITNGNLGYAHKDRNTLTPMSQLAPGEITSFKVHAIPSRAEGIRKGDLTFTTVATGSQKQLNAERQLLKDNTGYINVITSLLFDDISTDEGPLSVAERIELISPYIKLGDKNGTINLDIVEDEDKTYRVKFNDTTIYSSANPETREQAKATMVASFSDVVKGGDVTLAVMEKKKILNDVKSPVTEREKAAAYLKLISKEIAPGKIHKEGDKYFFYGFPRLNANVNLVNNKYKSVTLTSKQDGTVSAQIELKDYNKDYLVPTSFIPYELTGDKKIRTMNAYLIYDITPESADKLNPKKEEKKKEEAPKVKAVVGKERRNTLDKLIGFDKRIAQKNQNKKEADEKMAAAKAWWESPQMASLAKHFTLKEMFDIVNSQNPNSIARFNLQGITLYKGSDYTDLYHEAWHAFSQTFMTPKERNEIYEEVRNRSGFFTDYKGHRVTFKKATNKQVEEHLAEEFREFMLAGGKKEIKNAPAKKNFFQKMLDILTAFFKGVSVKELVANDEANKNITDLFSKLAAGNLEGRAFSYENSEFGKEGLNQTLLATDPNSEFQQRSLEDSRMLVNILDSVLSENIDLITEAQQLRQQKSGSTKWATSLIKDPVKLKLLYKAAKEQLEEIIDGLNVAYENGSDEQKIEIGKKLDLLDWAINNFGNVEDLMANRPIDGSPAKGVIGYHLLKSKIIDEDFKDAFFDEENETEESVFNKGREGYDKAGNEVSLKEQASKEIIFLLSGLHKVKNGQPVYLPGTEYEVEIDGKIEKRGIKEVEDFDVVWNTLVKNLAGTLNAEVMYAKLLMLANNPSLPFSQLLNSKLGDVRNSQSSDEFGIWTNFWQTFNKAYIPLLQTTVDIEMVDKNNVKEVLRFTVKPGRAASNTKQVERTWSNSFATETTEFIKPDKGGVRQLDLEAVIAAYPRVMSAQKDKFGFLTAIGFKLEDNPEIRKALEQGAVDINEVYDYISTARYRINDKGEPKVVFRDMRYTKQELPEDLYNYRFEPGGGLVKADKASRKFFPTKVYDSILELQAKHSAKFSNFMVSNAEGNTQFEHSLNNTMSVMVNAVNESPTYDDLIALPWMKHLDYRRNPFAKHSAWLKAIYPNFGKKSEVVPAVLTLENLSGVAVSIDGIFDDRLGTSSASADLTTKVLMDFHNLILKGTPELMRHADKSTSYALFVNVMNLSYSRGTSLYAIPAAFYKTDDTNKKSDGEDSLMKEALLPNLYAEYENIANVRARKKEIEQLKKEGKPLPETDYKYLEKASVFVSFQKVISEEVKEKLYAAMDKGVAIEDLLKSDTDFKGLIVRDIYAYMDKRVDAFKRTLQDIANDHPSKNIKSIIAENVYKSFGPGLKSLDRKVGIPSDAKIEEAAIKAFVYNSWIHNIESTNFLYGAPAQYNMAKEDFHKRNAGASSTGTLYRTDQAAIDYVNSVLGRKLTTQYAQEDPRYRDAASRAYNGTFNTAVFDDVEVRSAYLEEYAEAILESEMNKLQGKDEETKRKIAEQKVFGVEKNKDGTIKKVGTVKEPLKGGLLHAYSKMTEGDGQGWITLDSYRILLNLEGIWSDAQEALYEKIVKGEQVKPSDVAQTFPVQKLQYWGALDTDDFAVNAFHKFSVVPLVPTVIKNTHLKNLHEKMMREGIDYATFVSGSKVATISKENGPDKVYSDYDKRIMNEDVPFTKNVIFLNYLKNQLAIAPKFKEKVIFSTQLRKLVENGLVENGVPVDFMAGADRNERKKAWKEALKNGTADTPLYRKYRAYESLVDLESRVKKRELIDEIGWKIDPVTGNVSGDIKNLIDFIHAQFAEKDLADHELAFIKVNSEGKLDTDLSLSLSATKIEKMLNSIVSKRLINQKVTGEGLIQVSGALFENTSAWTERENYTAEDLKKWAGTNDLPTYHRREDGRTAAMKVKVAMQGNFKYLLDLPSVYNKSKAENITRIEALNLLLKDEAWLNEGDNRKMVTMTGVRIPVQGLNSMEFMEVYEFLPEEAGNIIIPPAEIVAKSGSDFDVDKLTVMMPAIAKYGEQVSLIKYDSSIKKSKGEISKEIAEKYVELAQEESILKSILREARDSKAFKEKTPQEQELLNKLRVEYGDKDEQLYTEITSLLSRWDMLRKKGLSYAESREASALAETINSLSDQRIALKNAFLQNKSQYILGFTQGKEEIFKRKESEKVRKLEEEILNLKKQKDAVSTKGIENDLITSIAGILSEPINYVRLITPNSTDALQEVAKELEPYVAEYSAKEDGESVMAGNKIFEYEYNLYKHQYNRIGKEVLGIGAVDNTFNVILNRAGASLKSKVPIYDGEGKVVAKFDQKLYMPHNTIKDEDGDAISLSNIMDVTGETDISDIISQLMNGWVDVAKDAGIFHVQGNKELGPILLFLIQAGVPFRTAVLFLSQPSIRLYAKQLRKAESSFSPLFPSVNPTKIVGDMLTKLKTEGDFLLQKANEKSKNAINKLYTNVAIKEAFGKEQLTDEDLKDLLVNSNTENRRAKQYAILRHFEEVLAMSNAVKEIKVNVNPDTKRSSNLYEALMKLQAFEKAKDNARLSDNLVSDILGDTVIKSFNIQNFQIELYQDLFKITNDPRLLESVKNATYQDRLNVGLTDAADYGNMYRSDFVSFIFQNKLKYFDPKDIKYYHSYPIELMEDIKNEHFSRGVFFKDGKLYMDPVRMANDFSKQLYTGKTSATNALDNSYKNLSLAYIPYGTFEHYNEYVHFVIEREFLRSQYKDSSAVEKRMDFQNTKELLKRNEPMLSGESEEDYSNRLDTKTFEEFLKNRALENIWNTRALFASDTPFSDKLLLIKNKYLKALENEYPVLKALNVNSATKKGVTYSNVVILDNIDDDSEMIDLYYSNMIKLADPSVIKVSDPDDNAFISEYFRKLSIVAYLQSGQNTKSRMSITRIMPEQDYLALMKDSSVNIDNAYSPLSLMLYENKFRIENSRERGGLKNRFKNYTIWEKPSSNYGNYTPSSIFDAEDTNTSVKLKNYDKAGKEIDIQYQIVPSSQMKINVNGEIITPLSASNSDGEIFINSIANPPLFFMEFELEKDTPSSLKKKALLRKLAPAGYTLPILKNLLRSEERVKKFLVFYQQALIEKGIGQPVPEGITEEQLLEDEKNAYIKALENLKVWIAEATENLRIKANYKGALSVDYNSIPVDNMQAILDNNTDKLFIFSSPKVAGPYLKKGGVLPFNVLAKAAPAAQEVRNELRGTQAPVSAKFDKKNIFTVKPIQAVDKKAVVKASIATQFIGFGEGITGSSTELYRQQAGALANTGNYSANDVIFVSVPGKRGAADIAKREQDKTIKEAIKAVEAGATILTDNKAYTDASSYNTGEKRLYDNMKAKGYNYSEITVDGQVIGTWSKQQAPVTSKIKVTPNKEAAEKTSREDIQISPEDKALVDNFIDMIEKTGKTPVFPAEGVGQELIGNVAEGVIGKAVSPETFLYLSRKLYDKFQWINPNWVEGFSNVLNSGFTEYNYVQSTQEISDSALEEFIKGCKNTK